jgi:hypothetical protein
MFRAMFSPIIRSTLLYLQYLVVFTRVAAGWFKAEAFGSSFVVGTLPVFAVYLYVYVIGS